MLPLSNRLIIRPAEIVTQTKSGILLAPSAQEKPLKGIVIYVGRGDKDEAMQVAEGDEVLYTKYSGSFIEHKGEELVIMRQTDVLAILNSRSFDNTTRKRAKRK